MLGSAVVNLEILENGVKKKLAYTGDIGRPTNKLLKSPEPFPPCEYLITESTYGNRLHASDQESKDELLRIVKETCIEKKGKLIIPAFSVGRTQEVVFMLNNFYNEGLLPRIEVFVDSPLSVNATHIFKMHTDCMNDDVKNVLKYDDDAFGFNSLRYIKKTDESKALNDYNNPCIIISSSGMAEAGRVKHHIANNIANSANTILIIGYCSPSSLGARIQQPGLREISILGEIRPVRAAVERIEAFSGHADYSEMIRFLQCQNPEKLQRIFLVHGEIDSQTFYKNQLELKGFKNIEIPERGEMFSI
jgi:metallo-beta-lactamase family protein